MVDIPLRTKSVLTDAQKLEKKGFFLPSILLYTQYLEQILLVALMNYYEYHEPQKIYRVLENIFEIKDEKQLTFGKILTLIPIEILDKKSTKLCEEIRNIRNVLAAHSFFVIQLDKNYKKMRVMEDVNNYRKFIRRIYKLVRKEYWVEDAEYFLKIGHPASRYRTLEKDALRVEKTLLKLICKITKEKVLEASKRIELLSFPMGKFMVDN